MTDKKLAEPIDLQRKLHRKKTWIRNPKQWDAYETTTLSFALVPISYYGVANVRVEGVQLSAVDVCAIAAHVSGALPFCMKNFSPAPLKNYSVRLTENNPYHILDICKDFGVDINTAYFFIWCYIHSDIHPFTERLPGGNYDIPELDFDNCIWTLASDQFEWHYKKLPISFHIDSGGEVYYSSTSDLPGRGVYILNSPHGLFVCDPMIGFEPLSCFNTDLTLFVRGGFIYRSDPGKGLILINGEVCPFMLDRASPSFVGVSDSIGISKATAAEGGHVRCNPWCMFLNTIDVGQIIQPEMARHSGGCMACVHYHALNAGFSKCGFVYTRRMVACSKYMLMNHASETLFISGRIIESYSSTRPMGKFQLSVWLEWFMTRFGIHKWEHSLLCPYTSIAPHYEPRYKAKITSEVGVDLSIPPCMIEGPYDGLDHDEYMRSLPLKMVTQAHKFWLNFTPEDKIVLTSSGQSYKINLQMDCKKLPPAMVTNLRKQAGKELYYEEICWHQGIGGRVYQGNEKWHSGPGVTVMPDGSVLIDGKDEYIREIACTYIRSVFQRASTDVVAAEAVRNMIAQMRSENDQKSSAMQED